MGLPGRCGEAHGRGPLEAQFQRAQGAPLKAFPCRSNSFLFLVTGLDFAGVELESAGDDHALGLRDVPAKGFHRPWSADRTPVDGP